SASGDYGADLILHKDGQKIVVQAKRYKNNVGIRAVQEIIPAVAYYKADVAWVVTNSYLTKQAQNLADSNDVVIIDREELMKWL
ncbi:MAG TPA: restriction endonuclease, partial [Metalysinibacillus sp.]